MYTFYHCFQGRWLIYSPVPYVLFYTDALNLYFSLFQMCILACIVIVTLKGMFKQFYDMVRLWRLCKRDFVSFNDNNFMVAEFLTIVKRVYK
ncbi:hypothetical protein KUTeg_021221 [Tegillarca granosa]|uniref:SLC26A/SulP transporter domain-containing protein n=1 Tax=Tegillarca granosa TaxID=220873 RepID=A0ABQ9ECH9_TEGGR|nr:hypothetical protein KUTeg_021221 [Tegillarca granosa]